MPPAFVGTVCSDRTIAGALCARISAEEQVLWRDLAGYPGYSGRATRPAAGILD